MPETAIPIEFGGPARYCPDCRRELFRANPDGSFNLAGKASVEAIGVVAGVSAEAVVSDAVCYRWRCRLRRWLRGDR